MIKSYLKKKLIQKVFSKIYENNLFSGLESISGPGSDLNQTVVIRNELPKILDDLKIKTFLDAACGDFYWMKEVNLAEIEYIGIDIVQDIIKHNKKKYENSSRRFMHLNLQSDILPVVDLIFCRDCLVHLPHKLIYQTLANFKKSGSKYILMTTFTEKLTNTDIITGQWRPLNFEIAPFNFPRPIKLIRENCTEDNGAFFDKSLALWKLRDLYCSPLKQGVF